MFVRMTFPIAGPSERGRLRTTATRSSGRKKLPDGDGNQDGQYRDQDVANRVSLRVTGDLPVEEFVGDNDYDRRGKPDPPIRAKPPGYPLPHRTMIRRLGGSDKHARYDASPSVFG